MNTIEHFTDFNNRHRGETVFVVGAGPQLGRLDDRQLAALEKEVSIGVNGTVYEFSPTYFLSAHIPHVRLAQIVTGDRTHILHMRPIYEHGLLPGIIPLRRRRYKLCEELPPFFTEPEPILLTRRNVVLGATHLALVMGARRIVYIAVEQRNALHFYHLDPDALRRFQRDLDELRDFPLFGIDHHNESYDRIRRMLMIPKGEAERTPFYTQDHLETFRCYLNELERRGVEVISTAQDSVVLDAGARHIPLNAILSGSNRDA